MGTLASVVEAMTKTPAMAVRSTARPRRAELRCRMRTQNPLLSRITRKRTNPMACPDERSRRIEHSVSPGPRPFPGATISWMAGDPHFDVTTPGVSAPEILAAGMGDSPLDFNPFLPEVHEDPYPLYERMRTLDPVHWNLPGVWMLTRHADAVRMLRHPRMSSDFRNSDLFEMFREMNFPLDEREPSMLFRDPPDHTRLPNLVSKAFSPKVIDSMRPFIAEAVDRLLAEPTRR